MALQSAGVEVTVIDESFYLSAAPGTTPILFVATRRNKRNASSTTTASGTTDINVGKVWTITSQRDLTDTFGTPYFYKDSNGNPIHGGELNEYGLQAAYSFLGISARAYVVRADVDLQELEPKSSAPTGLPLTNSLWVDTNESKFGIAEWNRATKTFTDRRPLIIDDLNAASFLTSSTIGAVVRQRPSQSFGRVGDYCLVMLNDNVDNALWYKNMDNIWVDVRLDPSSGNPFQAGELSFRTGAAQPTFTSNTWLSSWPVISTTIGTVQNGDGLIINGQIINFSITSGAVTALDQICTQINVAMTNLGVGAKNVGGLLHLFTDQTASSAGNPLSPDGKIRIERQAGNQTTADAMLARLGLTRGTYGGVGYHAGAHFSFPTFSTNENATGSIYLKTTRQNQGANWSIKRWNATSLSWEATSPQLFPTTQHAIATLDSSGGRQIPAGTIFVQYNTDEGPLPGEANFKVYRRTTSAPTTSFVEVPTGVTMTVGSTFILRQSVPGSSSLSNPVTVTLTTSTVAGVATAIGGSGLSHITSEWNPTTRILKLEHTEGGEIYLIDTGSVFNTLGFYNLGTNTFAPNIYPTGSQSSVGTLRISNWKPVNLLTTPTFFQNLQPTQEPANGALWFSSIIDEVDIMVHNGVTWKGYKNVYPNTSPNGPIITATIPDINTGQSDGTPLVEGDIWIDSSDPEMYGKNIYVYSAILSRWVKQDTADSTTPTGWLFADARWSSNGYDEIPATIKNLQTSDYLDPDAPDPALYPLGIKLWNTRRSGNNVKMYKKDAINILANNGTNIRFNSQVMDGSTGQTAYRASRWVNATGNHPDGSGMFGRMSQRGYVIKKFKEMIDTNISIRDTDTLIANLIACPGYPETIQNMIAFNVSRGLTAFVIGDTPFRLPANGTALRQWGASTTALDNNDAGSVSYDEYMGMFYPSGVTNDNLGNTILVPPSHMILRTMALSDQKSYPWFAPAGTRRGGVDNATAVGYLLNGEFQQSAIPQSLRDVLQDVKINPISTIPGAGLIVMGQKTRARNTSSLDRINVARLVAYLRRQLDILARPFLFEPNDRITRNEIKQSTESFLLELVGLRALYDFIVVCDETNNTPARIDRNELYVDVAVEPVKAVEFIYIPLRLKNTGEIAAGR